MHYGFKHDAKTRVLVQSLRPVIKYRAEVLV